MVPLSSLGGYIRFTVCFSRQHEIGWGIWRVRAGVVFCFYSGVGAGRGVCEFAESKFNREWATSPWYLFNRPIINSGNPAAMGGRKIGFRNGKITSRSKHLLKFNYSRQLLNLLISSFYWVWSVEQLWFNALFNLNVKNRSKVKIKHEFI